jgi:hypothetical protein
MVFVLDALAGSTQTVQETVDSPGNGASLSGRITIRVLYNQFAMTHSPVGLHPEALCKRNRLIGPSPTC